MTQRNLYTQTAHKNFTDRFFCTKKLYPKHFLHNIFFCTETFTHKKNMNNSFYRQTVFTQKIIRTEVLRTEGFTHNSFYMHAFLHTGVFTQTQIAHRNLCTQHAFTHCQLLHREALFPLLDHLPFVFLFKSDCFIVATLKLNLLRERRPNLLSVLVPHPSHGLQIVKKLGPTLRSRCSIIDHWKRKWFTTYYWIHWLFFNDHCKDHYNFLLL